MTERMPAVFVGHGNPMNAIRDTVWSRAWSELGRALPRPRAILSISAHWYGRGTAATALAQPPTIHDFGGFPPELYAAEYPAPGDPGLVAHLQELLAPTAVAADREWGLDHGTWSVLRRMYPAANVPVVQLRIDATRQPSFHFALGKRLAPLRDDGVLVLGSGNVVHNLRRYAWPGRAAPSLDWAGDFESEVRGRILQRDYAGLVNYAELGPDAALAIPTPDHYLPLLYVLGAALPADVASFPTAGIDGGSMSMLSVRLG